jgi:hypothetical protein
MPTFTRSYLRQQLGQFWLRDTIVFSTQLAVANSTGTVMVMTNALADTSQSGAGGYNRAWLLGNGNEYRVSSVNWPSGAWVTQQLARQAIASGSEVEIHSLLSPDEKNNALNDVIKRLRRSQEVGFGGTVSAEFYDITSVASPFSISVVNNAWYWADPTNSINRDRREFSWFDVVRTATGLELRISPAVPSGAQIALDAVVTVTLGSSDGATVDVPDERMVLAGAAVKSYDLISARSPGQEAEQYRTRRGEMAKEFSRLAALYKAQVKVKTEFDTPTAPRFYWWWD